MSRITLICFALFSLALRPALATDFSNVKSGLLLGIYATPKPSGMQVTGLIPGYSAEGRLIPGDILMRTTIDGIIMHRLRSTYEMENAKMAIGANRPAAVEIYRPGTGLLYAWVEFTPIAAPVAIYSTQGKAPVQSKAVFQMEFEKPGAREMFRNDKTPHPGPPHPGPPQPGFNEPGQPKKPMPFPPNMPAPKGSDQSAASLFGTRLK